MKNRNSRQGKSRLPVPDPSRFHTRYFAFRGYTLAVLFLTVVYARLHSNALLHYGFLFLIALGMCLRIWAGSHLGPHGNSSSAESPFLCRTGPYRFSRHPLYLSNILISAGLIFFANAFSTAANIILLLLIIAQHVLLANWEESHLRKQWRDEHATYLQRVPQWLGLRHFPANEPYLTSFRKTFAWQGRNLLYACAAVAVLWIAAVWK